MLELDLRTARDQMRGLKEDAEEAQKKAGMMEIAKVHAKMRRRLVVQTPSRY